MNGSSLMNDKRKWYFNVVEISFMCSLEINCILLRPCHTYPNVKCVLHKTKFHGNMLPQSKRSKNISIYYKLNNFANFWTPIFFTFIRLFIASFQGTKLLFKQYLLQPKNKFMWALAYCIRTALLTACDNTVHAKPMYLEYDFRLNTAINL